MNFFDRVYEVVKKIPKGKVMTYGQVALRLRSGPAGSRINISPRFVGWALHALRHAQGSPRGFTPRGKPGVPCHRVVNKDGRLAPGYAFGGASEQKAKLLAEGVEFKDDLHVKMN